MPNTTIDDEIFRFVYIAAMRDATLQGAYKGEKKWLWTDHSIISNLKDIIKPFIKDILDNTFSSQQQYDEEFLKISKKVCKQINNYPFPNNSKKFTFGNAQKLLNIMIKFFYIKGYDNSNVRACFKYCHCPMDSIMLKKVLSDYKKQTGKKPFNGNFTASWGKEDFNKNLPSSLPDRYQAFQNAVAVLAKNLGTRLEYDYYSW